MQGNNRYDFSLDEGQAGCKDKPYLELFLKCFERY